MYREGELSFHEKFKNSLQNSFEQLVRHFATNFASNKSWIISEYTYLSEPREKTI